MVSRSIVGRFLILAVLLVSLGVIAQAAIIITQGAGKKVAKRDAGPALAMVALAATPAAAAPVAATTPVADPAAAAASAQPVDAAPVRVVYPGPLGDTPIQPRKITASLSTSPFDAPAATPSPAPQAVVPAPAVTQATAAPAPAADPTPLDAVKPVAAVVASAEADAPATPPVSASHGVNLNNASVAELNNMGAGHIGQAIVQHRPYHSVDDLVKKRVVRRSIFDQIKNQVAAE